MAHRVTIQDIADELGLSRNTVSKALNNAEGLAEATRDRIIQKAMEMGYKQFGAFGSYFATSPSAAQGELLADKMNAHEIALFSANFLGGSHFATLILDTFQNHIGKLGFTLSMHRVTPAMLDTLELPLSFRRESTAGIICFEMFDRAYDEMLCELGLPILFVDGPAKDGGYGLPADQLYMDNRGAIARMVNAAIAAGKQRIGFVGNYLHCHSFYERYAAFRITMLMAGYEVDGRNCIPHNHLQDIGPALMELDTLPDFFICANDFVALETLQALRGLGYEVPRDVYLAGFDDAPESRVSMPALTTVHVHTQIMAITAIDLLRTRMEEPSLDYRIVYTETDLIYRDSTPFA